MTGISYADLTTQLTDLLNYPLVSASSATPSSSTDFNNILPAIINDAEQRIYREIDFLYTRLQDATGSTTINSRNFTLPAQVVVVESLAVIVPTAGLTPAAGTRVYPLRVSVDVLNMLWPQESVTAAPQQYQCWYAMLSNTQALIAPTPDKAYTAEVTGIIRPAPMSATNTTTYLGTNFPDLFLAACAVFGFQYFQRDLGTGASQGQSPQQQTGQAWESAYALRKASVIDEEKRRRGLMPEQGSVAVQGEA